MNLLSLISVIMRGETSQIRFDEAQKLLKLIEKGVKNLKTTVKIPKNIPYKI